MRWNREHIKTGMTVRSSEGQKLGKVIALGPDTFEIEKGFFILKDYLVRYSDIMDVRDGEAFLRYGKDDLRPIEDQDARGTETAAATTATGAGAFATGRQEPLGVNANRRAEAFAPADPLADSSDTKPGRDYGDLSGSLDRPSLAARVSRAEELKEREPLSERARSEELDTAAATTIPLARERLTVSKHDVDAGEVRIHKTVETETETVDVPVRRERVSVEHVKPGMGAMEVGDAAFEERDFTIPLHAEEIDISKETVVDDELRVTKVPYEEMQHVSENLRREHVEVRADSDEDIEEGKVRGWRGEGKEPTRY